MVAVCQVVLAQETVVSETNAPSVKWFQVNTPNFRLLYPQGFDAQAQRMANTLETIREPEARTIGSLPRKISIILQSQSALSNAFVTITPRRAEFYAMPPQNYNFGGTNDWLNLLATHEYRHMAQFQHATRGFNKALKYVLGYNVLAGMAYVGAPQWFWEGDAVATETAFTASGRGRIPNFDLVLRTNLQEGRVFNYNKQYLRSYKNNINDHYVLGYHMVSYLRKRTGDPEIWDRVTARSWNVPFIPFRFSSALKKESGLFVKDLYQAMAADLRQSYKEQLDTLKLTSFEKMNVRTSSTYTDYEYPQELEDGSIVARKSGIGDIEQLVLIKGGAERKIHTLGILNESGMQTAANSRVVWNEYRFDPRWLVRNYSVIVGYDAGSGQKHVIGSKSRYASAAISPNGYQVATVETNTDYQTRLLIIDYFSGKVVRAFDNPNNDFISMPRWTADGKELVALLTNKRGKAMAAFDASSGVVRPITDFSTENIGHPVPFENFVLYNSPASGIDNIYALDVASGNRFQITCSRYGAYNPAVSRDGKWIYYNEQGRNGLDIVRVPFAPGNWRAWRQPLQVDPTAKLLAEQEGQPALLKDVPQTQYPTKRYRRWKGLINPYSWGGTVSTTLTTAFVGVTSQDLLSTTMLSAGFVYDKTEGAWSRQASVSYQGWFPILDFSIRQTDRKVDEGTVYTDVLSGKKRHYDSVRQSRDLAFRWTENNVEGGFRIPLTTTTSRFVGNFTFGNAVGVTQINNFRTTISNERIVPARVVNDTVTNFYFFPSYVGNGNLIYNHFSILAYRLLKQSRRDINSKWGQELFVNIYNTPYGGTYSGTEFSAYGVAFFPGLFKHHSLWGYYGYQYSKIDNHFHYANKAGTAILDNNNYVFQNQIPLPRGLGISRSVNLYTMSANYTLPVWYPDVALGPLLNIQRMRANGFLDYAFGSTPIPGGAVSQGYTSAGVEVKFDVNVMRLLPQLDIGFRYSVGLQPAATLFEVLVGTINF